MSSVTVVGGGRIGLSLAVELPATKLFERVTVVGRRPCPAFLSGHADVRYLRMDDADRLSAACGAADEPACLMFCVPDDVLSATAAAWSRDLVREGHEVGVALHTSGFHGAEALAPLRRAGTAVGSWHPLVALPEPRKGALEGVSVGLEGDAAAVALGERLARALEMRVVRIRSGEKARYHAAAVFASNYLVACLSVASRELEASCEGAPGVDLLLPLARSALDGVAGAGLIAGATGPLVRGDSGTVAGHLAALDPTTASLYRALAAELLDRLEKPLGADVVRTLRTALGPEELGGDRAGPGGNPRE